MRTTGHIAAIARFSDGIGGWRCKRADYGIMPRFGSASRVDLATLTA